MTEANKVTTAAISSLATILCARAALRRAAGLRWRRGSDLEDRNCYSRAQIIERTAYNPDACGSQRHFQVR